MSERTRNYKTRSGRRRPAPPALRNFHTLCSIAGVRSSTILMDVIWYAITSGALAKLFRVKTSAFICKVTRWWIAGCHWHPLTEYKAESQPAARAAVRRCSSLFLKNKLSMLTCTAFSPWFHVKVTEQLTEKTPHRIQLFRQGGGSA